MALERPHPQRLVNAAAAAAAVKEPSSPTALLLHLPLDAAGGFFGVLLGVLPGFSGGGSALLSQSNASIFPPSFLSPKFLNFAASRRNL